MSASERSLLSQGVDAACAGLRDIALQKLAMAAECSPNDPNVWIWLAAVAESPLTAVSCLENARRLHGNAQLISVGRQWFQQLLQQNPVQLPCDVPLESAIDSIEQDSQQFDISKGLSLTSAHSSVVSLPFRNDSYPAESYPAESYPAESYPAESYPAESYPAEGFSGMGPTPGEESSHRPPANNEMLLIDSNSQPEIQTSVADVFELCFDRAPQETNSTDPIPQDQDVPFLQTPLIAQSESSAENLRDAAAEMKAVFAKADIDSTLPKNAAERPVTPVELVETIQEHLDSCVISNLADELPSPLAAVADQSENSPATAETESLDPPLDWNAWRPGMFTDAAVLRSRPNPVAQPLVSSPKLSDSRITDHYSGPSDAKTALAESKPQTESPRIVSQLPSSIELSLQTDVTEVRETIAGQQDPVHISSVATLSEFAARQTEWAESYWPQEPPVESSLEPQTPVGQSTSNLRETANADSSNEQTQPVIVVVDDSSTVRKLIAMTLENSGVRVIEAASSSETFSLIREHRPALIILEFDLTGTDGCQLCREIRSGNVLPDVPVLLMTGTDRSIDRLRARLSGCNDVISTPFSPDELMAKVLALVPIRRSITE